MGENPKVSIIIPVYKVEKFIHVCMKTLLAQTLKDIEIILVDDGSPDNCGKICDDYAKQDSRVKVIHQPNGRQGKARNNGLSIASGEYIGFVDSDDWVDETMFEKMYERAKKTDADIVMCDYFRSVEFGEKNLSHKSRIDKVFLEKEVFNVASFSRSPHRKAFFSLAVCWNKIFKRDFAIKYIKFPENVIFEDSVPMFVAFAMAKKISVIDEKFYYYRISNEQSSTKSTDVRILDLITVMNLNLDNLNMLDYNNLKKFVISSIVRDAIHHLKHLGGSVRNEYLNNLKKTIDRIKNLKLYKYITLKDKIRLWFYFNF